MAKKINKVVLFIRLEVDTKVALTKWASAKNLSTNNLVEKILSSAVKKHEKKNMSRSAVSITNAALLDENVAA